MQGACFDPKVKTMRQISPFNEHPNVAGIARRYYRFVPLIVLFGLLNGLLESLGIGLLVPLLSTMLGDGAANPSSSSVVRALEGFGAGYPTEVRLVLVAATMFGLVLLKGAVQLASRTFSAWVDGRAAHDILTGLSDRLERESFRFHLTADPARLVNVISTESWHTSDAIRAVLTSISAGANVAIFALMLAFVSWELSLLVAGGALIVRVIQGRAIRTLRRHGAVANQANQHLADRMLFAVYGARVIRLFGQEQAEHGRFTAASDRLRRAHLTIERISALLGSSLEVLHAALILIVLVVGVRSGVGLPALAAFLVLLNRIQPHLRSLEAASVSLAGLHARVGEVDAMLGSPQQGRLQKSELPAVAFRDRIEFDDVGFHYPTRSEHGALRSASFAIERGQAVAIIGRSGSGKSTLINLLCGLLSPERGHIRVDGVPLTELDGAAWRRIIGIAGQDIDLVDGSISSNIAFGLDDVSREAVIEAARHAQAHDFIMGLPDGYATLVGTRGLSLSGGQRQRIGIARAICRKPQILILDEATNAVDGPSERAVFELLRELHGRCTILVISHRAATLAHCDAGVVLDDGIVVESGPINTLARYRAMVLAESRPDASIPR